MKTIVIIMLSAALVSCETISKKLPGNDVAEALEMLESVYSGCYKQSVIKEKMTQLFNLYGIEFTKESLLQTGNELVSLRKELGNGATEIDIINAMLEAKHKISKSFYDDASRVARILEKEKSLLAEEINQN